MGIELVKSVEPTLYPVTLDDVLEHCRITSRDEDEVLTRAIKAATRHVERMLDRQLVTATWIYYLDDFPDESIILLPKPPLQSVSSISYISATLGTATPFTAFTVDGACEPGRVFLNYGCVWPTCRGHFNDVVITFKAGYGAAACTAAASVAAVPETYKLAIRALVGHWYENREAVGVDQIGSIIPLGFAAICAGEDWGAYG